MSKEVFKVGDIVEHYRTRLRAAVQEVKDCRDGTQELKVFTDRWWNSSRVVLVGHDGTVGREETP